MNNQLDTALSYENLEECSLDKTSICNVLSELLKNGNFDIDMFKQIVNRLFMKPHVRNIVREATYPNTKNTLLYELGNYDVIHENMEKYVYLVNLLKENGTIQQNDIDNLWIYFMDSYYQMSYVSMLPKPNMTNVGVASKIYRSACDRYLLGSFDAKEMIYSCDSYNCMVPKLVKQAIKINDYEMFAEMFTKFPKKLIKYRGLKNNTILLYANFFSRAKMVKQILLYCDENNRGNYITHKNDHGICFLDDIKLNDIPMCERKTCIDNLIKKPKSVAVNYIIVAIVVMYFATLTILPFLLK